jgi:hypothetical protein
MQGANPCLSQSVKWPRPHYNYRRQGGEMLNSEIVLELETIKQMVIELKKSVSGKITEKYYSGKESHENIVKKLEVIEGVLWL